ncbi:Myc box-dependent-interacting protein 1 [Tupaia chinensis]|uniref:Myc box-dependent-interacting protein 1 n=1 Tax=Tupaia chinensis TaxID=246437 RepID=L9KH23_TUPCH|nr:Myc box-dependent-interacting protein 1 [Tupaia chinensis]
MAEMGSKGVTAGKIASNVQKKLTRAQEKEALCLNPHQPLFAFLHLSVCSTACCFLGIFRRCLVLRLTPIANGPNPSVLQGAVPQKPTCMGQINE